MTGSTWIQEQRHDLTGWYWHSLRKGSTFLKKEAPSGTKGCDNVIKVEWVWHLPGFIPDNYGPLS